MARPPKNGVTRTRPRRTTLMQSQTKIHQASIGSAPSDFTKQEKAYWGIVVSECSYLNRSHRQWLCALCRIAVRVNKLVRFFARRESEFENENPGSGMLAYLDSAQAKRHPLAIELANSEKTMFVAMEGIGLNIKTQAKIMTALGVASKETVEISKQRAKYFT